tara:strand:- start:533 stop:790 length:258 start_codon:yes stop_codon:yes gene_type:complete
VALESIEVIDDEAFMDNRELETLKLPSCIKYIGRDAFAECPYLKNVAVEGVETVKMMFCKCEHLRELLITAETPFGKCGSIASGR